MLLFEDLQWADGGQLDFIDHLMEWAKDVPLLLVTLARPELLERRPGWGTSARSFNAIGLEPLTDANMRELLRASCPSCRRPPRSRSSRAPMASRSTRSRRCACSSPTAGSYRTATAPSARGDLGELAMPDSLRALVASRLDALDEADRSLLQDAAVLGKTFSAEALAAIYGRGRALSSSHGCARWPSVSCSRSRSTRLAGAWPVRLRAVGHPRGRLRHALAPRPPGPAPGGGALLRGARRGRAGRGPLDTLPRGLRSLGRRARGRRPQDPGPHRAAWRRRAGGRAGCAGPGSVAAATGS